MAASSQKDSLSRAKAQIRTYLARLTPESRRVVKELRATILSTAPDAVDAFSYGIPAFRLDGRLLIWYAGWKQHTSVYPITEAIRFAHARALQGYETSKGTVRFPLARPLPLTLVRRLVKARIAEVRAQIDE